MTRKRLILRIHEKKSIKSDALFAAGVLATSQYNMSQLRFYGLATTVVVEVEESYVRVKQRLATALIAHTHNLEQQFLPAAPVPITNTPQVQVEDVATANTEPRA